MRGTVFGKRINTLWVITMTMRIFDAIVIGSGQGGTPLAKKPAKSKSLGLEKTGVETDAAGFIKVNLELETNVSGIYALGDLKGPIRSSNGLGWLKRKHLKRAIISR